MRSTQVRELIPERFGANYLPEKPNFYKSKKDAQEAHEAVRPTDVMRTPEDVRPYLEDDLFKLYQLIWQRFVASQMLPAVFDQTTIDIDAGDYTFRATGSVQKFDGYLRVYQMPAANADREDDEKEDEGEGRALPQVSEGQMLRLDQIRPDQHFTEPPPRYNDATLVKELEEKGIGRPSTYASIISTIVEREYVTKDQGRFSPTMLGERVSVLLVKSFEDIFDVGFTARLEEELDEIEEGKLPWREAVKEFWDPFLVDLDKADDEMLSYKAGIPTGQKVREVRRGRTARAHQPPRILPGLLALSGLRFHPGSFARAVRSRRRTENRSTATTAAKKWSSSAAASACSWRAKAIRIARPLAAWSAARAKRGSRTSRWTKNAPLCDAQLCAVKAASANSSAARLIRNANSRAQYAGHQMSEMQRGRICPPRHGPEAALAAFSTAATAIRIAISPRRTSRSPSPARNAARHSS